MSRQETKKQVVTYTVVPHTAKGEADQPAKTDWLSISIVSAVFNALLLAILFITRVMTL